MGSSNLQRGKLQLRWRGSDGGGQGRGGDIVLGPKMLLFTLSLLLLVLGPLNLQGKIFHRHHVPHHLNLKESTRLLPLSKSKNSPPHTQTSEGMDQPAWSNYDPNQQRGKSSGAAKTNLIKRHGYFKVFTSYTTYIYPFDLNSSIFLTTLFFFGEASIFLLYFL